MHVDAVEERTADFPAVGPHPFGGATAAAGAVPQPPTRAGIHGADQKRSRRERGFGVGPRDGDDSVFQRLTQSLQGAAAKLGQLVEKEHPVVRETDFAGTRAVATTDQADFAHRMVRGAKRARAGQTAGGGEHPGDAVNGHDFQRLVGRERREETGQTPRKHCLARPRWPDHQEVVAPCRCDLECATGAGLTAHIGQVVGEDDRDAPAGSRGERQFRTSLGRIEELREASRRRARRYPRPAPPPPRWLEGPPRA